MAIPLTDPARVLWDYHRVVSSLEPADVVVGLGSYDLRVARWCVQLLNRSLAPWLVFTGAQGNWTQGRWSKSEAEVFSDEAISCGANAAQVLRETKATNIGENLRFTKALLVERGIAVRRAIFVTKPQTLRRVVASLPVFWPEIVAMTSCPDHPFDRQPTSDHTLEDLINEMVGDVQRMLEYPRRGFQAPQEVPPEVFAAYETLKDRGYTRHLLKC